MWTNYKQLSNSDVEHGNGSALQKGPLNFSFCLLSQKLKVGDLRFFIALLESSLHYLTPLTI